MKQPKSGRRMPKSGERSASPDSRSPVSYTHLNIPAFLKALGHAVQESGLDFEGWYAKDAEGIRKIAENFLA